MRRAGIIFPSAFYRIEERFKKLGECLPIPGLGVFHGSSIHQSLLSREIVARNNINKDSADLAKGDIAKRDLKKAIVEPTARIAFV